MPIVPGLWLVNPHKAGAKRRKSRKRKRTRRSRRNIGVLTILNPKKGGSMARKRRRKSRRRKSYGKRRKTYRRRRYTAKASRPHRRRRHRRRKVYAKNPRRYRRRRKSTGRKRHYGRRRRRNPSLSRYAKRSYGTATKLFSLKMAKNVIAGMAGFFSLPYIEAYIPFVPSSPMGNFVKKGLAAVAAYTIAGFIPGVSASQKQYVLYGSALNIGLDLVQQLPAFSQQIASATKMSGYAGYGQASLDMPSPTPARLTPTALIPAVLQ